MALCVGATGATISVRQDQRTDSKQTLYIKAQGEFKAMVEKSPCGLDTWAVRYKMMALMPSSLFSSGAKKTQMPILQKCEKYCREWGQKGTNL